MRGIGTLMIGREPWLRSNTCRDELAGREYYHPNDRGYEHEIKPRLEKIRKILHEKNGDRG